MQAVSNDNFGPLVAYLVPGVTMLSGLGFLSWCFVQVQRQWFGAVLRSQTRDSQEQAQTQRPELQRQLSAVLGQQDRLVNLRLNEEIDADTFSRKQTELRDREAGLKLNMEALDRSHHEIADLAVKAFELSQTLREQWLNADYATKRRILEIVCLNCKLVDATLVCEMRKPFDVLAEGLLSTNSRDDKI